MVEQQQQQVDRLLLVGIWVLQATKIERPQWIGRQTDQVDEENKIESLMDTNWLTEREIEKELC